MKTLNEIQKEIDLILDMDRSSLKKRAYVSASKRISFLTTCKSYIKSNPDKGFLLKESAKIESQIDSKANQYPLWITDNKYKDAKEREKKPIKKK